MLVVGLTGGIASGKSVVSRYLHELGAHIIDADQIAREIVYPHSPALQEIIRHFGKDLVNEDGSLKRKELGRMIFRDPEKRNILNRIMHPRIDAQITLELEQCRSQKDLPLIVIDAALLLETGLARLVDEIWLVDVPEELQIKRLRERDGLTEEEARRRLQAQMPLAEKRKYADRIIDNSGQIEETRKQIEKLWKLVVEVVQKS